MKHPNEYWLKYLLLFSGMRLEQIAETALMYEFPEPDVEYLGELRETLEETKPSPFRLSSAPVKTWLRRQRVMSLARDESNAVLARDYLGQPKVRRMLNAMLLSGTEPEEIAAYITQLTGRKTAKKTVDLYRHYFWNTKLLSLKQWREYLQERHDGKMFTSCLHQGTEHALWKLGHRVELPQEDVLRGVFHEASMRFFEMSQAPNTRDTALTAKLWAESIFKATEELNRSGDAVKQVITELKDMAIRLGRRDISSIEALSDKMNPEED